MISDSIVNVYLDGDNSVLMMKGPEKQITESYFGDRIAILVMVDKKEYERVIADLETLKLWRQDPENWTPTATIDE